MGSCWSSQHAEPCPVATKGCTGGCVIVVERLRLWERGKVLASRSATSLLNVESSITESNSECEDYDMNREVLKDVIEATAGEPLTTSRGVFFPDAKACPLEQHPVPSPDLLRDILLPFLDRHDMYHMGVVCRDWRSCAEDELFWRSQCLKRWRGKYVPLLEDYPAESDETPDPGVRLVARSPRDAAALKDGLEDLVVAMPLERIRRRLKELDVDLDRGSLLCSEKGEEVRELMGRMLLSAGGVERYGDELPEWARSMRGWRWSFHFAEKDSKRCRITTDELVRLPWVMRMYPRSAQRTETEVCRFFHDQRFEWGFFHPGHPYGELSWRFELEEGKRHIKVDRFPILGTRRDDCWGWQLDGFISNGWQRRPPPG